MNQVRKSSGNVFEDLGLPDSEGLLIKAELTSKIAELIEAANLTQVEAADKSRDWPAKNLRSFARAF
jgi:predicted XRE-type DNA-binding protein